MHVHLNENTILNSEQIESLTLFEWGDKNGAHVVVQMIGKRSFKLFAKKGESPKELFERVCRALRVHPTGGFDPGWGG